MAGNFHSDALRLVERYTMLDADTIRLRGHDRGSERLHATVEDPHAAAPPDEARTGFSSTSARPKKKKPTARSSRTRAPGIRDRRAGAGALVRRRPAQRPHPATGARATVRSDRRWQAGPERLLQVGRWRRQLRPREARRATGSSPARHAAWSSIRPTARCRISRGRGRSARTRTAAARLRRSDRALLRGRASRGRCTCPRRFRSSSAGLRRHPVRADVVAADSARRPRHLPGPHASVAGRFGWPLGRRHARRRDDESERQDLAQRSRRRAQPRGAPSSSAFTPVDAEQASITKRR